MVVDCSRFSPDFALGWTLRFRTPPCCASSGQGHLARHSALPATRRARVFVNSLTGCNLGRAPKRISRPLYPAQYVEPLS